MSGLSLFRRFRQQLFKRDFEIASLLSCKLTWKIKILQKRDFTAFSTAHVWLWLYSSVWNSVMGAFKEIVQRGIPVNNIFLSFYLSRCTSNHISVLYIIQHVSIFASCSFIYFCFKPRGKMKAKLCVNSWTRKIFTIWAQFCVLSVKFQLMF